MVVRKSLGSRLSMIGGSAENIATHRGRRARRRSAVALAMSTSLTALALGLAVPQTPVSAQTINTLPAGCEGLRAGGTVRIVAGDPLMSGDLIICTGIVSELTSTTGNVTIELGPSPSAQGTQIAGITANVADGAGDIVVRGSIHAARSYLSVYGTAEGINIASGGDYITITNIGSVTGGIYGIRADSDGGDIRITDIDSVTGTFSAIRADARVGDGTGLGTITIDVGEISSYATGISAYTERGGIEIFTSGGRVGDSYNDIFAQIGNVNASADIIIDTRDSRIYGSVGGIYARNYGSGDISIGVASVSGGGGDGISVIGNGDVTANIFGYAYISGADAGIRIDASGAGAGNAVIVQGVAGTRRHYVTSTGGIGIDISTGGASATVQNIDSIRAIGTYASSNVAISIATSGGDVTIDNIGSISITYGRGILVDSGSGDINITVSDVTTSPGMAGIETRGSGDATITIAGIVSGPVISGDGDDVLTIEVDESFGVWDAGAGTDTLNLNWNAGALGAGSLANVENLNLGAGTTTISAALSIGGDVTMTSTGTLTIDFGGGTAIPTLTAGGAVALAGTLEVRGLSGLTTANDYLLIDGATSLSGSFDIEDLGVLPRFTLSTYTDTANNFYLRLTAVAVQPTANACTVTNRVQGSTALMSGDRLVCLGDVGAQNISVGGVTLVLGDRANVAGITASGGAISVLGGADDASRADLRVISAGTGISADSSGADVTIRNIGNVTSYGDYGIDVDSDGGDISIVGVDWIATTGNVAIRADASTASGTATGAVTIDVGRFGANIARSGSIADAPGVNVSGMIARSDRGAITITTSGRRAGIGFNSIDAQITSADSTADITIDTSAGSISGSAVGIRARNDGSGDITTTVSRVSGGERTAPLNSRLNLYVYNGIELEGRGNITVNLAPYADISGDTGIRIDAANAEAGKEVLVQGVTTSGVAGREGQQIFAYRGGISITTGGASATVQNIENVESTRPSSTGAAIQIDTSGGDITISDIDIIIGSGGRGIEADSGGGDITISGVSSISASGWGVFADTRDASGGGDGSITIFAGGVGGRDNGGIAAYTHEGAIVIDTAGERDAGYQNNIKAELRSETSSADITIDLGGSIHSMTGGIEARNQGDGRVIIDVANISFSRYSDSADNIGILAFSRGGTDITLAAGATISRPSLMGSDADISIRTGESMTAATPADTITLHGTVTGAVETGAGDDRLFIGANGGFGSFDGGAGSDTLELAWSLGALDPSKFTNVENLILSGGSTIVNTDISFAGDLTMTAAGDLTFDAGGNETISVLNIGGAVILDGILNINNVTALDRSIVQHTLIAGATSIDVTALDIIGFGIAPERFTLGTKIIDRGGSFDFVLTVNITTAQMPSDNECTIVNRVAELSALASGDGIICLGTADMLTTTVGDLIIELGNVSTGAGVTGIAANVADGAGDIILRGYVNATGSTLEVVGLEHGINIASDSGEVIINNINSVMGFSGHGILVDSGGGEVTINNIDSVTGADRNAIEIDAGSGNVSITNIDTITSASGRGILVDSSGTITIDVGNVTSASAMPSIEVQGGGNTTITLSDVVNGAVITGGGDDRLIIDASGASFGSFYGGLGTMDVLHFNYEVSDVGAVLTSTLDNQLTQVERVTFEQDTLAITSNFAFNNANIYIDSAQSLDFANGITATADFFHAGNISIGGAGTVGSATIGGDLTLTSTSTLTFDLASASSFDSLTVSGAISLGGTLTINPLAELAEGDYILIDGSSSSGLDPNSAANSHFDTITDIEGYRLTTSVNANHDLVLEALIGDVCYITNRDVGFDLSGLREGDTITCLSNAERLQTTVDGITIELGNAVQGANVAGIISFSILQPITIRGASDATRRNLHIVGEDTHGIFAETVVTGVVTISNIGSVTRRSEGDTISVGTSASNVSITGIDSISANTSGITVTSRYGDVTIGGAGEDAIGSITAPNGSRGIAVFNHEGAISITTGGPVTTDIGSTTGSAIYGLVSDSESSANITIDTRTNRISGSSIGVRATNRGNGNITITTADVHTRGIGVYTVLGGTDPTIPQVTNSNITGDITIDTSMGDVTTDQFSTRRGIQAFNYGSGKTIITTGNITLDGSGSEFGATRTRNIGIAGIAVASRSGANITLVEGATIRANSGVASGSIFTSIITDEIEIGATPADTITLHGTATGIVLTRLGDDVLNVTATGSFERFDGGDGTDILNLGWDSGTLIAGALANVEQVNITAGQTVIGGDIVIDGTLTVSAQSTLDFDVRGGIPTLTVAGAITLGGTLKVSGLGIANQAGEYILIDGDDDTSSISGNFINADSLGTLEGFELSTRLDMATNDFYLILTQMLFPPADNECSIITRDGVDLADLASGDRITCLGRVPSGLTTSVGGILIELGNATIGAEVPGISANVDNGSGDVIIRGNAMATRSDLQVTGTSDGINVAVSSHVINIDNLGSVTGNSGRGIFTYSTGGEITIDNIDSVTGTGDGIYASSGGGDVNISNIDSVTGNGGHGISADSQGGDITITDISNVTGTGGTSYAIYASARRSSDPRARGDITIDVSNVSTNRGMGGIRALTGRGAITITTSGKRVGTTYNSISAEVQSTNTNDAPIITIDTRAADIYGQANGISAINNSVGDIFISATNVSGLGGDAISVDARSSVTANIFANANINGTDRGIQIIVDYWQADESVIVQGVTASESIATSGQRVTGANVGIDIDGMSSTSAQNDVYVRNFANVSATTGLAIRVVGLGDASITDIDNVHSGGAQALFAYSLTGTITIDVGDVTAGSIGAFARIGSRDGAYNSFARGDVTIDTSDGDVLLTDSTATLQRGIYGFHFGSGIIHVTAGNIAFDANIPNATGILTWTQEGANITLVEGAIIRGNVSISDATGASIVTGTSDANVDPPDRITLHGTATGGIFTRTGDDVLTIAATGDFGGFDGGDGRDILNLAWDSDTLEDGVLANVEQVYFGNGTAASATTIEASATVAADMATINSMASLALEAGAQFDSNVTNQGTISIASTATIGGAFDMSTGTLTLNVDTAATNAAILSVNGALTLGTGTLTLTQSGSPTTTLAVGSDYILVRASAAPSGAIGTGGLTVDGLGGLSLGDATVTGRVVFATVEANDNDLLLRINERVSSNEDNDCTINRGSPTMYLLANNNSFMSGDTVVCRSMVDDPLMGTINSGTGGLSVTLGEGTAAMLTAGIDLNVTSDIGTIMVQGLGTRISTIANVNGDALNISAGGSDVTVQNLASVTSTTSGDAIDITSGGGAVTIENINTISGAGNGIVVNSGTGTVIINVSTITASGTAIQTSGGAATITVGGAITSGATAIQTGDMGDTLTLNGTVSGAVLTQGGDDILNINASGSFGSFTGGAGADTLNLNWSGTQSLDNTDVSGVETINFNAGETTASGTFADVNAMAIASGATLTLAAATNLGAASLTNEGALAVVSAATIGGAFDMSTGSLTLSAEGLSTSTGRLTVGGMLTLGGSLTLGVNATALTADTYILIDAGSISGMLTDLSFIQSELDALVINPTSSEFTIDSRTLSLDMTTGNLLLVITQSLNTNAPNACTINRGADFFDLTNTLQSGDSITCVGTATDRLMPTLPSRVTSLVVNVGDDTTTTSVNGVSLTASPSVATALTVQGNVGSGNTATIAVTTGDAINLDTQGGIANVTSLDSVTATSGDAIDITSGGGAVSITNIDTITSTGGRGIVVDSGTGTVTITVGAVSGSTTAIQTSAGNDVLTLNGAVTGAVNTGGGTDTLTIASGGSVSGAIDTGDGMDTVTIAGTVSGAVNTGDGIDMVTISGTASGVVNTGDGDDMLTLGAASAATNLGSFDGGDGTMDTLHFGYAVTNINTALTSALDAKLSNVERATFQENALNVAAAFTFNNVDISIGNSQTLTFADSVVATADFINAGTISIADTGAGTANINGDLTMTADGTLSIDIASATSADRLTISGDVTLAGTLQVNGASSLTTEAEFLLIDSSAGTISGRFTTENLGTAPSGMFLYTRLDTTTNNFYLVLTERVPATPNMCTITNRIVTNGLSALASGDRVTCIGNAPELDTTIGGITVELGEGDTGTETDGIRIVANEDNAGTITIRGGIRTTRADLSVVGSVSNGMTLSSRGSDIIIENIDTIRGSGGFGVNANARGGTISITNVDTIIGSSRYGIVADTRNSNASTGTITIDIDTRIHGLAGAVRAYSDSGNITITANQVTSTADNSTGIFAETAAQGVANITIEAGGSISGGNTAIRTGAGNDEINLFGTASGLPIQTRGGDDVLTIGASGDFGSFDGGDGTDTLELNWTGTQTLGGGDVANVENINVNNGSTTASGTFADATSVSLASGASLDLASGTRLTSADLIINSDVSIASTDTGAATIGGALTLNSGGTLTFDVTRTTHDNLAVSGAISLDGTITVRQTGTLDTTREYVLIAGTVAGTPTITQGSHVTEMGYALNVLVNADNDLVLTASFATPANSCAITTATRPTTDVSALASGDMITCLGAVSDRLIASNAGGVTVTIGDASATRASSVEGIAATDIAASETFTITGGSGSATHSVSSATSDAINIRAASGAATGDIRVSDLDSVTATGTGNDAIDITSGGGAVTIENIDTISSTGGRGIAVDSGTGTVTITVSAVSGSATAIETQGTGDATITTSGAISGAVTTGGGDDTLNIGASSSFGSFAGGAGSDILNLGWTGTQSLAGSAVSEVETINFNAGTTTITGNFADVTTSLVATGADLTLAASATLAGTATINSGADVTLNTGATLGGAVTNSGALVVDSTASIGGALTLNSGGTLTLDTQGLSATQARLTVNGALNLGGSLTLNRSATPLALNTTYTLIGGASSVNGTASALTLTNALSTLNVVAPTGTRRVDRTLDVVNNNLVLIITEVVTNNETDACTISRSGGFLDIARNPIESGDSITCLGTAPMLSASGAGTLTINVGNATTAATVAGIAALAVPSSETITITGGSGSGTHSVSTSSGDAINIAAAASAATGDIRVSDLDTVEATGGSGDAIDITSGGGAVTIRDITTISSTGGRGIVVNSGAGDITITVGTVNAGSGIAIETSGGIATITVGAVTSGATAIQTGDMGDILTLNGAVTSAVLTGGGADEITIAGTVTGAVQTHTGADILTISASGSFVSFDGGDGTDRLNLEWTAGRLGNGALADVEQTFFGDGSAASATTIEASATVETDAATINNMASLTLAAAATLDTELTNQGTLSVASTATIGGALTLDSNGVLTLDVSAATETQARLVVNGAISPGGRLTLNGLSSLSSLTSDSELLLIDGADSARNIRGTFSNADNLGELAGFELSTRTDTATNNFYLVLTLVGVPPVPDSCTITSRAADISTLAAGDRVTCLGTIDSLIQTISTPPSARNLTITVGVGSTTATNMGRLQLTAPSDIGTIAVRGARDSARLHNISTTSGDAINITAGGSDVEVQNLARVTATGTSGDAIAIASGGGAVRIENIDTITSTAGRGIFINNGDGEVTIEVGAVTAAAGSAAIQTQGSGDVDITLNGAANRAIMTDAGDDMLTIGNGGDFASFDGGAGTDTLNLGWMGTQSLASSDVSAVEIITFNNGATTASGSFADVTAMTIANGATLTLAADTNLGAASLTNNGILSVVSTATIGGALDMRDGTLTLDTQGLSTTTGRLAVGGGLTLGGTLTLTRSTTALALDDYILIGGATSISGAVSDISYDLSGLNIVAPTTSAHEISRDLAVRGNNLILTITERLVRHAPNACTINRSGSFFEAAALQSGDILTCLGTVANRLSTSFGDIIIAIGDSTGAAASVAGITANVDSGAGDITIRGGAGSGTYSISTSSGDAIAIASGGGAVTIEDIDTIASTAGRGIFVNSGAGNVIINASNVSSHSTSAGIQTQGNGNAEITLLAGAEISGGATAIQTDGGDDEIIIQATSMASGAVLTGGGADEVTIEGTVTGAVQTGTGADTLTLRGDGRFGSFDGGDGMDRLEIARDIIIDATFAAALTDVEAIAINTDTTATASGAASFTGSSDISIEVAQGAVLDFADGASLAADVSNAGTLSIEGAGMVGAATISGDLTLNANGILQIDLGSASNYDRLTVSGEIALDGMLAITALADFGVGSYILIDGSAASNLNADSANALTINQLDGFRLTPTIDTATFDLVLAVAIDPATLPCRITSRTPTPFLSELQSGDSIVCRRTAPTLATSVGGVTIVLGETAQGAVVEGITANVDDGAGDITIRGAAGIARSALRVEGAARGIDIDSGGDDISIDNIGNVSGGASDAIFANSGGGAVDITNLGNVVAAGNNGIDVSSSGGDVTIRNIAMLTSTGTGASTGDGIAIASLNGNVAIVGLANVSSAGGRGIFVEHGTGTATIEVDEVTSAADTTAIETQGSGDVDIVLNGAARAGTERGNVITGAGNDRLTLGSGGSFRSWDGGDGTDTLALAEAAGTLDQTLIDSLTNVEAIRVADETTTFSGTVDFSSIDDFAIEDGGTLNLAEGANLATDVTNAGILAVAGAGTIGTANITGNLTLSASGALAFDIGRTSDRLRVSGAISLGNGALTINPLADLVEGEHIVIEGTEANSGLTAASIDNLRITDVVGYDVFATIVGFNLVVTIDEAVDPTTLPCQLSNRIGTRLRLQASGDTITCVGTAEVLETTVGGIIVELGSASEGATLAGIASHVRRGAGDVTIRGASAANRANLRVVSTSDDAISVRSDGGDVSITNIGTVSSSVGRGIFVDSGAGAVTIAVGDVTSATESASIHTQGSGDVDITLTGTASGDVETGAGNDRLTLGDGGELGGMFDGGAGTDTLALAWSAGTLDADLAGALEASVEAIAIAAGATTLAGAVTFAGGGGVSVASGATLDLAAGASLASDVSNAGTLSVAGTGAGAATISGDLTLAAGGALTLDITPSAQDRLSVSGAVTLGGNLVLRQASNRLSGSFPLVNAGSIAGSFANADDYDGLINNALVAQRIDIDTTNNTITLISEVDEFTCASSLTVNQCMAGEALLDLDNADNLSAGLDDTARAVIAAIDNVATLGALLDELTPHVVAGGLDIFRARSDLFRESLLGNGGLASTADGNAHVGRHGQGSSAGYNERRLQSGARFWGSFGYARQNNGNQDNEIGYVANGLDYSIGVSDIALGNLVLGVAGSFSDYDLTAQRGTADSSAAQMWQIGGAFGYIFGGQGVRGRADVVLSYSSARHDVHKAIPNSLANAASSGRSTLTSFGAVARFVLDGTGGRVWPIRPFVSIGYDHVRQNAAQLSGGAADLSIDANSYSRFSVGYGARFEQGLGTSGASSVWLSAGGYSHFGDTRAMLQSRFTNQGANAPMFATLGHDIRQEIRIEGGASVHIGDGWRVAAEGHAAFGHITGYGARATISKSF